MRPWIAVQIALVATSNLAHGRTQTRSVGASRVTLMWKYGNVQKDCSPELGIVKVHTRPQHGKLIQQSGFMSSATPVFQKWSLALEKPPTEFTSTMSRIRHFTGPTVSR
jgi:hypothetical protein